mgnify:CR=1 FL=1|jgi:hypothetical protein
MYQCFQFDVDLYPCSKIDASGEEYSEEHEDSVSWLTLDHTL